MTGNMETKRLRVWEQGRYTPIIAIRVTGEDSISADVFGPNPRVIVVRLKDMRAEWNPFSAWTERGLILAHRWLECGHWDECKDGDTLTTMIDNIQVF